VKKPRLFGIFVFKIHINSLNYIMMREFRKPDLNAPRFRHKHKNVLNKELYKSFIEKYPHRSNIDYKTFVNIVKTSNKLFWEKVIDHRDGVELPENLGYIFIGTCTSQSPKRPNINFGKSIKYGFTVNNTNLISDNKLAKIFYTNYPVKYRVKDREIWTFMPCRVFKRTVAKTYPENWEKYIVVPDNLRVSKLYNAFLVKEDIQKRHKTTPLNYNEFDLS
jgi:hypothetical protein